LPKIATVVRERRKIFRALRRSYEERGSRPPVGAPQGAIANDREGVGQMSYPKHVDRAHASSFLAVHIACMSVEAPRQRALRTGRHSRPGGLYVVTTVVANRQPVFADFADFALALRVAPLLDGGAHWRDSRSLCWVLMTDHCHLLVQTGPHDSLSMLVNRLKAHSARICNLGRNASAPLWQRGFHDRALRKEQDIVAVARYIVRNPIRAGLTRSVGSYPFWNAVWL